MADIPSFGSGLGQVIGTSIASSDLSNAMGQNNSISGAFGNTTAPYNSFGTSFIQPAANQILDINGTAGQDPNLNYNTFMQNYQTSPGAKYDIGVANDTQNNSAAASGKLLSGSNERALSTIDQGIASKYANTAYTNYLAGNSQQFGQLETSLGNMFSAIGVGTTATGQQASVDTAQMNNDTALAQAQAKNDQAKGSGLGTMFSGFGTMAAAF